MAYVIAAGHGVVWIYFCCIYVLKLSGRNARMLVIIVRRLCDMPFPGKALLQLVKSVFPPGISGTLSPGLFAR